LQKVKQQNCSVLVYSVQRCVKHEKFHSLILIN